jgi:hypothetical protein
LKTVLNGKRDSIAEAIEQAKTSGIKIFQQRITRTTQRGIPIESTLIVSGHRSSVRKLLLHWGKLIYFFDRAD